MNIFISFERLKTFMSAACGVQQIFDPATNRCQDCPPGLFADQQHTNCYNVTQRMYDEGTALHMFSPSFQSQLIVQDDGRKTGKGWIASHTPLGAGEVFVDNFVTAMTKSKTPFLYQKDTNLVVSYFYITEDILNLASKCSYNETSSFDFPWARLQISVQGNLAYVPIFTKQSVNEAIMVAIVTKDFVNELGSPLIAQVSACSTRYTRGEDKDKFPGLGPFDCSKLCGDMVINVPLHFMMIPTDTGTLLGSHPSIPNQLVRIIQLNEAFDKAVRFGIDGSDLLKQSWSFTSTPPKGVCQQNQIYLNRQCTDCPADFKPDITGSVCIPICKGNKIVLGGACQECGAGAEAINNNTVCRIRCEDINDGQWVQEAKVDNSTMTVYCKKCPEGFVANDKHTKCNYIYLKYWIILIISIILIVALKIPAGTVLNLGMVLVVVYILAQVFKFLQNPTGGFVDLFKGIGNTAWSGMKGLANGFIHLF